MAQNAQPDFDDLSDIAQSHPGTPGGPMGSAGEAAPEVSDPNFSAAHMDESRDPIDRGATRMDTGNRPGTRPAGTGGSARIVRDIMTADVNVCEPDTPLYYVARMMEERDVGSIPVVETTDAMNIVGVVTDRDIAIRAVAKNQDATGMKASDIMSTGILTVTPEMPIEECVRRMEQRQVRRAPVIDATGRLCGIIAQADIARCGACDQAGELVTEVSEPRGDHTGGQYH